MPEPSRQRTDLAVLAAPDRVTLVRVVGRILTPLVQMPVTSRTTTVGIARVVDVTLRAARPDRILLSVLDDTPYESVAEPVVDACSGMVHCGRPEICWLPDIARLADLARGAITEPEPRHVSLLDRLIPRP